MVVMGGDDGGSGVGRDGDGGGGGEDDRGSGDDVDSGSGGGDDGGVAVMLMVRLVGVGMVAMGWQW